jgi:class 3 adenylate cyclase
MAENMIALVFTDLVNSTAIKNNLSGNSIRDRNESYRDTILLPHRQRVTESLSQYEGRVVEEPPGDGYFLVFPNAIQAAQWAVAIQNSHIDNPILTPLGTLAVKIGVHIGSPLVHGNQFIGQEVDYAARVAALAVGEQILLSESTAAFVRSAQIGDIKLYAHGDRDLKGIGSVPIFELLYADRPPHPLKEAVMDAVRENVLKTDSVSQSGATDTSLESPEGQVGIGSAFYVASSFEDRCCEEVQKPGSLIRIKSPCNMGKSSLMLRVLDRAAKLGYRTVAIDLEQTNQKFFNDLDKFMQWFCASVGKPLGVRVKAEEYWDDIFGANDNSTDYFEKYLLNVDDRPLVLAIDNFDRVFKYADIETDFCGLLRGWHERSRSNKLWGNLRLIIVYSQEPYLQKDINQSPFNVGLPIELNEFTSAQVKDLVGRHRLTWSDGEVEQFEQLIGGHPYLVRSALYHIAAGDLSLEEFLRTAPTEAGIYCNHLRGHLKSLEDHSDLEAAIQKVVASEQPVRLRSAEAFKLDSMGLVVRVDNNVAPRCLLYKLYFRDRLGSQ